MIIVHTKEESDALCEQEISHILTSAENSPIVLTDSDDNRICFDKGEYWVLPERKQAQSVKTKKYGTLAFFWSLSGFLESRYNKGVIPVFCSSVSSSQGKRGVRMSACVETLSESLSFEGREFGNRNLFINSIEGMIGSNAYLIVVERNKNTENGVQIINQFKIKPNVQS